jgi:hypothetical protein
MKLKNLTWAIVLLLSTLAFIGCGSSDNFVFTNNFTSPVGLEFQNTPQRTAGTTFNVINVAVVDQNGAVVPGANNAITISLANPNGAVLSGTLTKNAVNGVASFDDLSVNQTGSYTFVATSPGLNGAESQSFAVTAGTITQLAFVQQPTDIFIGTSFDPQVTVEARDALGNLVPNAPITLSIANDPSGTAVLGGTVTANTVNGLATFPADLTVSSGSGTGFTLQASSDSATTTSSAFDVNQLRVLLVRGDDDADTTDVQSKLNATGVLSVDDFDARAATPTLAELQNYDAVLTWTDSGGYNDPTLVGDRLADFFDAGGRVVVAVFANASIPIQGRFVTDNYLLIEPLGQIQPTDSLGTINEPNSPLLADVTTFTADSAYSSTGGAINGGIVVAEWGDGRPLIVRGVVDGRNRVDLNFFPPSDDSNSGSWIGDGAELMRNALLFQ